MNATPQETVVLTLGRLPTALEIARSFAANGWRVVVADPFGMHLTRMSRSVARSVRVTAPHSDRSAFADELRQLARGERASLVVPISEETPYVADAGLDIPVFCGDLDHTLGLHDKYAFWQRATQFGLSVPRSSLGGAPETDELIRAADFVIKPRHSCSGRGVSFHTAGDHVRSDAGQIVQERLHGQHVSSFAVAREGRALAIVAYVPRVESGTVSVCFERVEQPAVIGWTRDFVARSAHTGFMGIDFIVDSGGYAAAIECNPRATSGIHFLKGPELAAAIAGREISVPLRAERLLAEKYSCLTTTEGAFFTGGPFRRYASNLLRSTDVTWSRRDPLPFALMMVNTWPIIWRALRQRKTFAEVAVQDIEWRGSQDDDE